MQYLFGTVEKLNSIYVRAVTTYALALVDQSSMPAHVMFEDLKNKAIVKGITGHQVWRKGHI